MPETELKPQNAVTVTEETRKKADGFLEEIGKELKVKGAEKDEVSQIVANLAKAALAGTGTEKVPRTLTKRVKAIIADIDKMLSQQLNEILHQPDFQALEGSWRGLYYLVNNSELEANKLEIKVLNISKEELSQQMQDYDGTSWDQSPLFRKIYTEEFGVLGGRPFGCLVGDYYFDHELDDVDTLEGISKIAAAAHAPFISSVKPQLFGGMSSWEELNKKKELGKIFAGPKYNRWNKMRENLDTRYIALTMPRVLAREPFGANTRKIKEFNFEEEVAGSKQDRYVWSNAAYAMARNIGQSFKENGWCVQIRGVESGGLVEKLPQHCFETSDGSTDMKIPSEVLISDRRESELSALGFMPICYIKNSPDAVFIGGQSLHKPSKYGGKMGTVATANHELASRIPYTFAVCRFAHYVKSMVRDKIGATMTEAALQEWLQDWINDYVLPNPDSAGPELKAEKPLQAAKIQVVPIAENPGYYNATLSLLPHYQLEGMTTEIQFDTMLKTAG